ncbi:hypothetical protein BLNAU_10718 [Blattamonas nauphoetae]|uniref:Uncharacterized protein n=1 Tax=Blattamonas nauphoetae TaxID=2049346 RepID=A0ABQ9XSZ6_9EUKA|nr:hypothetical protein BLNAU_10718 [Blattamonas nauphoetae]
MWTNAGRGWERSRSKGDSRRTDQTRGRRERAAEPLEVGGCLTYRTDPQPWMWWREGRGVGKRGRGEVEEVHNSHPAHLFVCVCCGKQISSFLSSLTPTTPQLMTHSPLIRRQTNSDNTRGMDEIAVG